MKLTATGTGDSLFVAQFPEEYAEKISSVAEYIRSCDVKMTNLETNLSDFDCPPNAYSGGTWINTRKKYLEELFRYGFNYFGTANNHVMDYCHEGLLSTIDTLDSYHAAHSGTGRSLEEAARPAIIEVNGGKVAIFAVDCSFQIASKAGQATKYLKARPGVNYLRHDSLYKVTEEQANVLKEIAKSTNMNNYRERLIATGFMTPDPEGYFFMGTQKYTTKSDVPTSTCHAGDKKRILDAVKKAKEECEYVFMLVHCHDDDYIREENPAEYLKEFARSCIDAGVSAVFGGGCHRLRPMEIYKNAPIFYSLGDFIYQGLKVEFLPADFMEKFGVDINSTAQEGLLARSRGNKVGLHCNKKNYQTILPKLYFEDGKLVKWELMPVYLNFDRKDDMNGLPEQATGKEAEEIFTLLQDLSAPYGVKLKMENGMITPA